MESLSAPIYHRQGILVFDGSEYSGLRDVKLPSNFEINESFSISFWIKTNDLNPSVIIAKMIDKDPYNGWDLLFNDFTEFSYFRFQMIHKFPENYLEVKINASEILDEQWHLITIVHEKGSSANTIKFYIDGKKKSYSIIADRLTNSISNSYPLTVGGRDQGSCTFHGSIMDLRIYSSALNELQINEILKSSEFSRRLLVEQKSSIILKDIKKTYDLHHQDASTIYEKVMSIFNRNKDTEKLVVLDDINLEIKKGEMIGITGRNGSGKTTLLKIMAGIIDPTEGKVSVNGKVTPFLALGSGFNVELDAKENIILYGILLGESKKNMEEKIHEILEFAELEHYTDVKLKYFSTGMYMRLAFAVAVSLDPDIILIDEVLAVGDVMFQQRSFQKLLSFKNRGKTIVLVTHSMEHIGNLCDRAIFLDKGRILAIGTPSDVIEKYRNSFCNSL